VGTLKFIIISRGNPFTALAGTEILARSMSFELAKQGHEVDLVYGDEESLVEPSPIKSVQVVLHGLQITSIPYLSALVFRRKCSKRCIQLVNDFNFDAVIALGAGTFPGYIFHKIKKSKKRLPLLVYYAMDSMVMEYARSKMSKENAGLGVSFKKWVYYTALIKSDKASCSQSDLILASSKDTINHLTANYDVPLAKINLLYEGIPDNFAVGYAASDPEIPTFLHVAGGARKGTDFLLSAMKILTDKYGVKAKVVITRGSAVHVQQAKSLGVDAEVYEYVPHEELKRLYASCTALVVPSMSEGFCLPVIEAAMFGKPSIAFGSGSLPELINDNLSGFVVAVGDVNTLSLRMYQMCTDDDLRMSIGNEAKRYSRNFTISRCAKSLVETLQESLGDTNGGSNASESSSSNQVG